MRRQCALRIPQRMLLVLYHVLDLAGHLANMLAETLRKPYELFIYFKGR